MSGSENLARRRWPTAGVTDRSISPSWQGLTLKQSPSHKAGENSLTIKQALKLVWKLVYIRIMVPVECRQSSPVVMAKQKQEGNGWALLWWFAALPLISLCGSKRPASESTLPPLLTFLSLRLLSNIPLCDNWTKGGWFGGDKFRRKQHPEPHPAWCGHIAFTQPWFQTKHWHWGLFIAVSFWFVFVCVSLFPHSASSWVFLSVPFQPAWPLSVSVSLILAPFWFSAHVCVCVRSIFAASFEMLVGLCESVHVCYMRARRHTLVCPLCVSLSLFAL